MNEPACWSWPVPTITREEEIARLLAAQEIAEHPDDRLSLPAIEMFTADWGSYRFGLFHANRCAMCGRGPGGLVEDHDHWTGLVRGMLCRSCNRRESMPDHIERFDGYRERSPAAILGYRRYYEGVTWPYGWWENEVLAQHLTGNPGWTLDGSVLGEVKVVARDE